MVKENKIHKDEMPVNLQNHAWAGRLSAEIWNKYADICVYYFLAMCVIGIGIGIAGEVVFNRVDFPVWTIGIIFVMWSFIFFPIVYQFMLIKNTYLIDKYINDVGKESWRLQKAIWFKRDLGEFSLSNAMFNVKDKKRYFFWVLEGDYFVAKKLFKIVDVSKQYESKSMPTSADLAGLPAWRDTVTTYARRKYYSMQQLLQYTAFAIIIAIEVIGIYFLSGRDI